MKYSFCIISVVGSHAGEGLEEIFARKQEDIERIGKTYWLIQSHKAKTQQVQNMCKEAEAKDISVYCVFIGPSQKGGAKPTKHEQEAKEISADGYEWTFPEVSVTGKISRNSTGLVLDSIELFDEPEQIDLWDYTEFQTNNPVKLMLGASTVCAFKRPSKGMQSRFRNVIGRAKLTEPYSVYLR